jgi:hypothetical protein
MIFFLCSYVLRREILLAMGSQESCQIEVKANQSLSRLMTRVILLMEL